MIKCSFPTKLILAVILVTRKTASRKIAEVVRRIRQLRGEARTDSVVTEERNFYGKWSQNQIKHRFIKSVDFENKIYTNTFLKIF